MVGEMRAARRLLTKLLKSVGAPPRVMITDNSPLTFPTGCASWNLQLPSLKSRGAARVKMSLQVEHRQHKGLNNRAENSHQPTRRRERIMKRFKSRAQEKRFLSIHDQVANLLHIPFPEYTTAAERHATQECAFTARREISKASPAV